jgi:glycosyltransferase involved in cell wall biosynthesis
MLTQYYAPEIGAAQTRLRATAGILRDEGHEVTVLTAMPNHLRETVMPGYEGKTFIEEQIDGIRVLRTWVFASTGRGFKRLGNYFSFVISSLLAVAKVPKVDLVFFESPPLFLGLTAVALARKNKARLVMNISDLWPASVRAVAPDSVFAKAPLYPSAEALENWLYKRSDLITAVTPGIQEALLGDKGLPEEKVAFLPNGIDPALFSPRPANERSEQPKIFLAIGSHGYAHGMETILEAADKLRHRKDIHFRFVGEGSVKAELMAQAQKLSLSNVTFAGSVELAEVADELAACTASLVTLRDDPFYDRTRPARTFPSLACARPVIFAGRGDFATMVNQVECGQVVAPGDAGALAAAVEIYAGNAGQAFEHGLAGAKYTVENYSWSVLVRSWLEKAMP